MMHKPMHDEVVFEEALLEHYWRAGDDAGYARTLERMRAVGYEPRGRAAPKPGSPYYRNPETPHAGTANGPVGKNRS